MVASNKAEVFSASDKIVKDRIRELSEDVITLTEQKAQGELSVFCSVTENSADFSYHLNGDYAVINACTRKKSGGAPIGITAFFVCRFTFSTWNKDCG